MAIAIYNTLPPPPTVPPKPLPPPPGGAVKIVGIHLNTPNDVSPFWTVFGKVVVKNPAASPANVHVELKVVGPGTLLDSSDVTIPATTLSATGLGTISLEGVTPGPAEGLMCVAIYCTWTGTSNATAELYRLIAISVNPASVVLC